MGDLVSQARRNRCGLGAFNVIQIEHAEAIVAGAEAAGAPVVLQLSENTAAYHRGLAPLALACLRIAEESSAPVSVHLDHATRPELVTEAVSVGVSSVMFDASTLTYADNVTATAEITGWCHLQGVWVEAELGEVGGKDPGPHGTARGAHAAGARTDPGEAADYVAATGIDALAVAVGSSHAMRTRDAVLDEELIAAIAARVAVPLVLHGSSGVPDAGLRSAVAAGMTKVNIATHLNRAMTASLRAALEGDPELVDPRRYLGPGRDAVTAEVSRLLGVLGAAAC